MTGPTVRYAALNAAYWSGFCLVMAFSSVFLLSRGLTNAQIGVTLAASGAVSVALQPVVARMAGRSRRPLRVWIAALAALIAVAGAALALPRGPIADAVLFGVVVCVLQVVLPLVNAIGMQATHQGVPVDFGSARAIGSFTFALTAAGMGALVAAMGPAVLPVALAVVQGLLMLAALTFAFQPSDASGVRSGAVPIPDAAPLTPAGRLRFWVLLAGVTGLYTSHTVINNFAYQIAVFHGGDASHLGLSFTIAATLETLPMLFFRQIVGRWHPGTLLRFAAAVFVVKAVATLLAPSLAAYLATMVLQVGSFALLIPA
ncbi:MAG: MFS transporter, partial [Dermatophilaceae bacterium]